LTANGRLHYPIRRDPREYLRRDLDRSPVVARPPSCGAMARLIDRPIDHRLPARQPAGFFVSGEIL
jgi:hypothetical protein